MKLIHNMSLGDRFIRVMVAIALLILAYSGLISGTAAVLFSLLAVVFLLTSLAGTCPLYIPLGIKTHKK